MNNRFKFRYFNEQNKEIYNVSGIDFETSRAELKSLNGLETLMCKIDLKNLMQCTGLKDKNGTLIYEGDIVKGTCGILWGNLIVYFNEQRATFYLDRCDKEYKELRFHSKNQEDNFHLEVIGNKYGNPELLQECE